MTHQRVSSQAEQFLSEIGALRDEHIIKLQSQLLHARDNAIGANAKLGVMTEKYERAQAQVDSLIHQLNLLHTSRTWRIGRFVLLPLRGVRWILTRIMN